MSLHLSNKIVVLLGKQFSNYISSVIGGSCAYKEAVLLFNTLRSHPACCSLLKSNPEHRRPYLAWQGKRHARIATRIAGIP